MQVLSRRDANAGTRRCDEAARPVRGEGSTSATTPMLRGPSTADLTALTNAVTRAIHFNGGEENSEKSKLLIFPDKARYVPSCSTSAITRTSALVTTTASTSLRPRTLSLSEINGAAALCAVERLRSEVASVASAAESQRFRFLSVIANRDAEIDSLKSTRDAALFLVNQRNIEIQVLQSTRDSDFTRVARRDEQLLQRDAVILLRNAVILSLESARDSAVSALSAALSAKDAALLRCADVEATAAASASATASTLALASATATATATVASSLSRAHAAEAALEEAVYALQACEATLAALAICGAAAAKNLLREGVEDCREHAAVPEGVEDCREHAAVPVRIAQKHASSAVSLAATLAEVLATLRVATRTNTLAQGGGRGVRVVKLPAVLHCRLYSIAVQRICHFVGLGTFGCVTNDCPRGIGSLGAFYFCRRFPCIQSKCPFFGALGDGFLGVSRYFPNGCGDYGCKGVITVACNVLAHETIWLGSNQEN